MQVESLEILEKADVAPVQARAIVRAIGIVIAGAGDAIATKSDIAALRQDLLALRHELTVSIPQLAAREDLAQMRGELRAEMQSLSRDGARQMYLAILGQMAVMLGFAYFFATHLR